MSEDKTDDIGKPASSSHDEHANTGQDTFRPTEIDYNDNSYFGTSHSPFVFAAALLASFGGFSFGYGMSLPSA